MIYELPEEGTRPAHVISAAQPVAQRKLPWYQYQAVKRPINRASG